MDIDVSPYKPLLNSQNKLKNFPRVQPHIFIYVEARSLREIFNKNLRGMADRLKYGVCIGPTHSDCTMKVMLTAPDSKTLLKNFLNQVLKFTHTHHTIFCSMYIEELTEKKIEAQLFGNWFNTFDNELKFVSEEGFCFKKKETNNNLWKTMVFFKF